MNVEAGEKVIVIDGKSETRKALFAMVDATDSLVTLNRDKQKVYPSVEINPNFAGTGKAYLVGLAVTDSPASLGTELLEFTSKHSSTVLTQPIETKIEFEDVPADPSAGAFSAMAAFFTKMLGAAPTPPVVPVDGIGQRHDRHGWTPVRRWWRARPPPKEGPRLLIVPGLGPGGGERGSLRLPDR
ncbi:GPO family capsid scaffolding protein [Sphingomonas arantia]|uniref:GPO family capsid scaffolding protein n=1 Tax=Sphingomonas arantia TaxID=1460676 RepID=A0ABW4TXD1_9SPHN